MACIVRFQVFPFVPDEEKRPTIRRLFEMDVGHSAFQKAIEPLLQWGQFVRFAKTIALFYKSKEFYIPLHPAMDIEIVEQMFWEETDEQIARALLTGFLGVSWRVHTSMLTAAVNLWLAARTIDDKQPILYMLRTMMDT